MPDIPRRLNGKSSPPERPSALKKSVKKPEKSEQSSGKEKVVKSGKDGKGKESDKKSKTTKVPLKTAKETESTTKVPDDKKEKVESKKTEAVKPKAKVVGSTVAEQLRSAAVDGKKRKGEGETKKTKKGAEEPPITFVPCKKHVVEALFKTPPTKKSRNASPAASAQSAKSSKAAVKAKVMELMKELEASEESDEEGSEDDENDEEKESDEEQDEECEKEEEDEDEKDAEEEEDDPEEDEDEEEADEEDQGSDDEGSEEDEDEGSGEEEDEGEGSEVKEEKKNKSKEVALKNQQNQAQLANAVEETEVKTATLRNSFASELVTFQFIRDVLFKVQSTTLSLNKCLWPNLFVFPAQLQHKVSPTRRTGIALSGRRRGSKFMNSTTPIAWSYSTCGWIVTKIGIPVLCKSIENMSSNISLGLAMNLFKAKSWRKSTPLLRLNGS